MYAHRERNGTSRLCKDRERVRRCRTECDGDHGDDVGESHAGEGAQIRRSPCEESIDDSDSKLGNRGEIEQILGQH